MPPIPVHPLDKLGFILFGAGLALLTYSLSAFSESSLSHTHTLILFFLSIFLLLFYYWHSKTQPYPIVKIALLNKRTFRISVIGNLYTRLSFGGIPFLLPLLFQIGLHYTPQRSGLLLVPISLGILLIKPLSKNILCFFGYKKLLIINTFLLSLMIWSFILINKSTSLFTIELFIFLYGFFLSLQYTSMNSLAYANINEEEISAAASIVSTIQQLAQSFGVAFAALLVNFFLPHFSLHSEAIIKSFHESFFAIGLATLSSIIIFLRLKPEDGQELIGKKQKMNNL